MKTSILSEIIACKQRELVLKKQQTPVATLETAPYFVVPTYSLRDRLRSEKGLIAEFKRRAPSSGALNPHALLKPVVQGYAQAGATGISILTDSGFFGACPEDLAQAASVKSVPLLRKDFIVDEYQVIEAKAQGADLILLIASVLNRAAIRSFSRLARSLNLEVLLEIHQPAELDKFTDSIDLIGVNNRNLQTFETDLDHGLQLLAHLPDEVPAVSESGIHTVADGLKMLDAGYQALLIGTQFMKTPEPAKSFEAFATALKMRGSLSLTKPGSL